MQKRDEYLKLFIKYNHHLFNYILTRVPNYSDAEDLLQETASIMWGKFDDYKQGTNFLAWARTIAKYKILNYYRKKREKFRFDDEILARLSVANKHTLEHFGDIKIALAGCLNRLRTDDANLIKNRYFEGISLQQIAQNNNSSVHTLYKRVAFILLLLQACINETLASWGIR